MIPQRILYVVAGNPVGGISTGLLSLLRNLDPKRYRPHVAVLRGGKVFELFQSEGIPCFPVEEKNPVREILRRMDKERFRLVQSCDAASAGALAASRKGLPHVWFVGGSLQATLIPNSKKILRIFRDLLVDLSDVVVVPSHTLAREEFSDLPTWKRCVIPWGIDLRGSPRRSDGSCPRIAMVGNFYPTKRHLDFLKTAAAIHRYLPKARFFIGGQCIDASSHARRISHRYRAQIQAAMRRHRLPGIVRIESFHPKERTTWLGSMNLLLVPSCEGISQALLEAGACGIPIVAVRAGGNPEVIRHGRSGLLVPYRDPQAMAEAALAILSSPPWARCLGREARQRILSTWHAKRQAQRFQRLYDKLLTKKHAGHNAA